MVCVGLQAHDESRATCDAESLGVRLRLNNGVVTMSTQRRRRLGSRCREYARRKRTCRRRLEKILGHQTLTSLLARVLVDLFCQLQHCPGGLFRTASNVEAYAGRVGGPKLSGSVCRRDSPSPAVRKMLRLGCFPNRRRFHVAICLCARCIQHQSIADKRRFKCSHQPSDFVSMHSSFARQTIQRRSTKMTMMFGLRWCVIRARYFQVLRSS